MKVFNYKNSHFVNVGNKLHKDNLFSVELQQKSKCLVINIPHNTTFVKPIYLTNNLNNLDIIIIINDNSKIDIIDHKNNATSNTMIICKNNTITSYYLIQEQNTSQITIDQHANSQLTSNLLANNTSNNTLQLNINLLDKLAITYVNILQYTTINSVNKIKLLINHLHPYCSSNTVTRTIATDKSVAHIIGKILVNKNANNTNADLQNKSLLLSKHATINSCPELDIYNQNVKCTHGSSIGYLDQNILLYMQARGIKLDDGKKLLLQAFLAPIIKKIKYLEIVEYMKL